VEINVTMDFYGLQMHQLMVWIQTMQLKTLWTNIYHVIIINWHPIFMNFKHIITKRLVGRKIKTFVDLIFRDLLCKKHKFLKPLSLESLTPSKMVHLGEINKRIFEEFNKIDLQTTFMSFNALLNFFSTDKETFINAL
jgi:hypothetical protein